MKDKAAQACHSLCCARVAEEVPRRKGNAEGGASENGFIEVAAISARHLELARHSRAGNHRYWNSPAKNSAGSTSSAADCRPSAFVL